MRERGTNRKSERDRQIEEKKDKQWKRGSKSMQPTDKGQIKKKERVKSKKELMTRRGTDRQVHRQRILETKCSTVGREREREREREKERERERESESASNE